MWLLMSLCVLGWVNPTSRSKFSVIQNHGTQSDSFERKEECVQVQKIRLSLFRLLEWQHEGKTIWFSLSQALILERREDGQGLLTCRTKSLAEAACGQGLLEPEAKTKLR